MFSRSSRTCATVALMFIATGCGGGGGTNVTPGPVASSPSLPPSSHAIGKAVATIHIPAKHQTTTSRRRAYVSPATASISIAAIRSDGAVEMTEQALTSTTNGCNTQRDNSVICTVPFQAPITGTGQSDEFQVYLGDTNPIDAGNILSYGDSTGNPVASTGTNDFSLVLGAVIGGIETTTAPPANVTAGEAQDIDIPLSFSDADEDGIDAAFDDPATITIGGTAASSFTVTQPAPVDGAATIADPSKLANNQIVVHYDGTGAVGNAGTVTISSNSPQTASNDGAQVTDVLTFTIQNQQIP